MYVSVFVCVSYTETSCVDDQQAIQLNACTYLHVYYFYVYISSMGSYLCAITVCNIYLEKVLYVSTNYTALCTI